VSLKLAAEVCRKLMLEDWGEEALAGMEAEMEKKKDAESDKANPKIDIDYVLSCVSGAWMARYYANAGELKKMFIEADDYDDNGEGVLSEEEFAGLLKSDGLSWLPTRQAKGMFRECLQESMHRNRICPEGFLSVAFPRRR
jgi:hypothetical protein